MIGDRRGPHGGVFLKRLYFAALAAALAAPAGAQVGHAPERSPFVDLDYKQDLTLLTGWYAASKDPAGTANQSGPMVGLRYDVYLGGPASLTSRFAYVNSERTILDPSKPRASRVLRTQQWPLYLFDVGLGLNLTGRKSYKGLVPVTNIGLGIAADWKKPDRNGYSLGTTFAISLGGGVRWIYSDRLQFRADVTDYLYSISYPTSFYEVVSDGSAVLPGNHSQNVWKHNAALSLGASYMFFR